jgi:CheY-like chemotaxis protein
MKTALRVLNLEDHVTDAELNETKLCERWPECEMVRVDTRAAFVSALERDKYDLILSDFTIPGFDGREALTIAHEKCPETPFLFVSGTIGEETAIDALKSGATDYVLKHRLMRLIPAVERALREVDERAERGRAEAAMRESEHKYREVFECLAEAAFLTDEKTGKIIDTNRCAEKLLGCGRARILGRKQSEFIVVSGGAAADAGAPFDSVLVSTRGQAVPVRIHASKLTIHDHPLVLWLCHQLTGPAFNPPPGGKR